MYPYQKPARVFKPVTFTRYRFADRDMYMRYAGGGVGHYRVTLSDTPANVEETRDDFAMDDDIDPPRSIIATTAESAGCGDVEDTLLDDDNHRKI